MNSAHPLDNTSAGTNFITTLDMMLFPFALVLMYGRMLKRMRHAAVIFGVMLTMMIGLIGWPIYWDTLQPNPGLTAHAVARTYDIPSPGAPGGKRVITIPAMAALPVDQHLGNLEGKELRFGTSAAATFAAITTDVTCGAVNAEHDSLNPMAGLSPLVGMWINCVFGGKGVGTINLLLSLIIGIFLAGQMVGRTAEYLGKKVSAARSVRCCFETFSAENPGQFPSAITHQGANGQPTTAIEPVKDGSDIQSIFFDMWRHEHPNTALQDVPGDMVTASGSGLDPNITLSNAEYQLERVTTAWAKDTKRDSAQVGQEIKALLQQKARAPFHGLVGEPLVNVLEVNLELRKRYGSPA